MASDSVTSHGTNKLTVVVTGKYTIQKALLLDDRVQPILV